MHWLPPRIDSRNRPPWHRRQSHGTVWMPNQTYCWRRKNTSKPLVSGFLKMEDRTIYWCLQVLRAYGCWKKEIWHKKSLAHCLCFFPLDSTLTLSSMFVHFFCRPLDLICFSVASWEFLLGTVEWTQSPEQMTCFFHQKTSHPTLVGKHPPVKCPLSRHLQKWVSQIRIVNIINSRPLEFLTDLKAPNFMIHDMIYLYIKQKIQFIYCTYICF